MSVQFSRGCPFTCEFCDIITIYGRRPRTKSPAQLIGELDALLRLGWRKEIFVVDDNFIGNHKAALQLAQEVGRVAAPKPVSLRVLHRSFHRSGFAAGTAGCDGQSKFLPCVHRDRIALRGVAKGNKKIPESPPGSLDSIRSIQQHGLWVMGGFIVGFDSDKPDIFDRQIEFIESAAIPWAMTGVLQAPPTTPLYERMKREGRLMQSNPEPSNFDPPEFPNSAAPVRTARRHKADAAYTLRSAPLLRTCARFSGTLAAST